MSWILILSFGFGELARAAPAAPSTPAPVTASVKTPLFAEALGLQIPLKHVQLKERHEGNNGRLIVHIQDAHSNLSGQKNLASALGVMMTQEKMRLVLVEGADEDATLTSLRPVAEPAVWKQVAGQFLMSGKISGEEYLNLTTDHPMKIVGIEDAALYARALRLYRRIVRGREEALGFLRLVRRAIARLKNRHYPEGLRAYETKKAEWDRSLGENTGILGADHFGGWYESLTRMAEETGAELADLKELERLGRIRKAQKDEADAAADLAQLDTHALIRESGVLEERIYALALPGEDAFRLRALDRYAEILQKAYRIQLSTDEYGFLLKSEPLFPREGWTGFLNRKLVQAGFVEELIPAREILESARKDLHDFYETVRRRDEAFVQKTRTALDRANQDKAFLIAGGYHTANLTALLKQGGYSYVVLTPVVTEMTDHGRYEEILLEAAEREEVAYGAAQNIRAAAAAATGIGRGSRLRELVESAARLSGADEDTADEVLKRFADRQSYEDASGVIGRMKQVLRQTAVSYTGFITQHTPRRAAPDAVDRFGKIPAAGIDAGAFNREPVVREWVGEEGVGGKVYIAGENVPILIPDQDFGAHDAIVTSHSHRCNFSYGRLMTTGGDVIHLMTHQNGAHLFGARNFKLVRKLLEQGEIESADLSVFVNDYGYPEMKAGDFYRIRELARDFEAQINSSYAKPELGRMPVRVSVRAKPPCSALTVARAEPAAGQDSGVMLHVWGFPEGHPHAESHQSDDYGEVIDWSEANPVEVPFMPESGEVASQEEPSGEDPESDATAARLALPDPALLIVGGVALVVALKGLGWQASYVFDRVFRLQHHLEMARSILRSLPPGIMSGAYARRDFYLEKIDGLIQRLNDEETSASERFFFADADPDLIYRMEKIERELKSMLTPLEDKKAKDPDAMLEKSINKMGFRDSWKWIYHGLAGLTLLNVGATWRSAVGFIEDVACFVYQVPKHGQFMRHLRKAYGTVERYGDGTKDQKAASRFAWEEVFEVREDYEWFRDIIRNAKRLGGFVALDFDGVLLYGTTANEAVDDEMLALVSEVLKRQLKVVVASHNTMDTLLWSLVEPLLSTHFLTGTPEDRLNREIIEEAGYLWVYARDPAGGGTLIHPAADEDGVMNTPFHSTPHIDKHEWISPHVYPRGTQWDTSAISRGVGVYVADGFLSSKRVAGVDESTKELDLVMKIDVNPRTEERVGETTLTRRESGRGPEGVKRLLQLVIDILDEADEPLIKAETGGRLAGGARSFSMSLADLHVRLASALRKLDDVFLDSPDIRKSAWLQEAIRRVAAAEEGVGVASLRWQEGAHEVSSAVAGQALEALHSAAEAVPEEAPREHFSFIENTAAQLEFLRSLMNYYSGAAPAVHLRKREQAAILRQAQTLRKILEGLLDGAEWDAHVGNRLGAMWNQLRMYPDPQITMLFTLLNTMPFSLLRKGDLEDGESLMGAARVLSEEFFQSMDERLDELTPFLGEREALPLRQGWTRMKALLTDYGSRSIEADEYGVEDDLGGVWTQLRFAYGALIWINEAAAVFERNPHDQSRRMREKLMGVRAVVHHALAEIMKNPEGNRDALQKRMQNVFDELRPAAAGLQRLIRQVVDLNDDEVMPPGERAWLVGWGEGLYPEEVEDYGDTVIAEKEAEVEAEPTPKDIDAEETEASEGKKDKEYLRMAFKRLVKLNRILHKRYYPADAARMAARPRPFSEILLSVRPRLEGELQRMQEALRDHDEITTNPLHAEAIGRTGALLDALDGVVAQWKAGDNYEALRVFSDALQEFGAAVDAVRDEALNGYFNFLQNYASELQFWHYLMSYHLGTEMTAHLRKREQRAAIQSAGRLREVLERAAALPDLEENVQYSLEDAIRQLSVFPEPNNFVLLSRLHAAPFSLIVRSDMDGYRPLMHYTQEFFSDQYNRRIYDAVIDVLSQLPDKSLSGEIVAGLREMQTLLTDFSSKSMMDDEDVEGAWTRMRLAYSALFWIEEAAEILNGSDHAVARALAVDLARVRRSVHDALVQLMRLPELDRVALRDRMRPVSGNISTALNGVVNLMREISPMTGDEILTQAERERLIGYWAVMERAEDEEEDDDDEDEEGGGVALFDDAGESDEVVQDGRTIDDFSKLSSQTHPFLPMLVERLVVLDRVLKDKFVAPQASRLSLAALTAKDSQLEKFFEQAVRNFFDEGYWIDFEPMDPDVKLPKSFDNEPFMNVRIRHSDGFERFRDGRGAGYFRVYKRRDGSLMLQNIFPELPGGKGLGRLAIGAALVLLRQQEEMSANFTIYTDQQSVWNSMSRMPGFDVRDITPRDMYRYADEEGVDDEDEEIILTGIIPDVDAGIVEDMMRRNDANRAAAADTPARDAASRLAQSKKPAFPEAKLHRLSMEEGQREFGVLRFMSHDSGYEAFIVLPAETASAFARSDFLKEKGDISVQFTNPLESFRTELVIYKTAARPMVADATAPLMPPEYLSTYRFMMNMDDRQPVAEWNFLKSDSAQDEELVDFEDAGVQWHAAYELWKISRAVKSGLGPIMLLDGHLENDLLGRPLEQFKQRYYRGLESVFDKAVKGWAKGMDKERITTFYNTFYGALSERFSQIELFVEDEERDYQAQGLIWASKVAIALKDRGKINEVFWDLNFFMGRLESFRSSAEEDRVRMNDVAEAMVALARKAGVQPAWRKALNGLIETKEIDETIRTNARKYVPEPAGGDAGAGTRLAGLNWGADESVRVEKLTDADRLLVDAVFVSASRLTDEQRQLVVMNAESGRLRVAVGEDGITDLHDGEVTMPDAERLAAARRALAAADESVRPVPNVLAMDSPAQIAFREEERAAVRILQKHLDRAAVRAQLKNSRVRLLIRLDDYFIAGTEKSDDYFAENMAILKEMIDHIRIEYGIALAVDFGGSAPDLIEVALDLGVEPGEATEDMKTLILSDVDALVSGDYRAELDADLKTGYLPLKPAAQDGDEFPYLPIRATLLLAISATLLDRPVQNDDPVYQVARLLSGSPEGFDRNYLNAVLSGEIEDEEILGKAYRFAIGAIAKLDFTGFIAAARMARNAIATSM